MLLKIYILYLSKGRRQKRQKRESEERKEKREKSEEKRVKARLATLAHDSPMRCLCWRRACMDKWMGYAWTNGWTRGGLWMGTWMGVCTRAPELSMFDVPTPTPTQSGRLGRVSGMCSAACSCRVLARNNLTSKREDPAMQEVRKLFTMVGFFYL